MPAGLTKEGNIVTTDAHWQHETPLRAMARIGGALLLVSIVFALCFMIGPGRPGSMRIALGFPAADVVRLRLIRVASAAVVGAALATAGTLLQALLRNPLADPYILGISSGAGVGVMAWIVFGGAVARLAATRGFGGFVETVLRHGVVLPAIGGAMLTCLAVVALARPRGGALEPLTLLLAGVVVNAFNGALIVLLNSLVPYGARADIMNYLFGYIREETGLFTLALAAGIFLAGWVVALFFGQAMDIATLSDVEAGSLGLRLPVLRWICFGIASLMTAATLALAGPIGFVGLICPHICRLVYGPGHRSLLFVAPLFGAAFLMLCDTFVRATGGWFNGELPVGVLTALCGGPFFLYLLRRGRSAV